MNIKIVIPNVNEFEKVNDLAKQVHDLHVKWRPDLFLGVLDVIGRDRYKLLIEQGLIYVAKLENEIVGYFIYNIVEKENPTMRYIKQLTLEAMCVNEKYRGMGIGTLLLNFVEEIANQNDCTDIYLTVNEENENAIKLYEKVGMKVKSIAYSKRIK